MLFSYYANSEGQQLKIKKKKFLQIFVFLILLIKKVGKIKLEKQLQNFVQKQRLFKNIFLATFGIFVSLINFLN
jgi:hypothetical protein